MSSHVSQDFLAGRPGGPVAHMCLDMGMHRGPLLAYLMADPELSLQSMLSSGSAKR